MQANYTMVRIQVIIWAIIAATNILEYSPSLWYIALGGIVCAALQIYSLALTYGDHTSVRKERQ
jgi:hypothetical protein